MLAVGRCPLSDPAAVTLLPRAPSALHGFSEASRGVLTFLHQHLPMGLWCVTRKNGHSWLVLHVDDRAYSIAGGSVLHWSDTLCERMVGGSGPNIAPDVGQVPSYRDAPMRQVMPIGAYVGLPVTLADGTLFGTLCGLDAAPQADTVIAELPLLRLLVDLLANVAAAQLARDEQDRANVRARAPVDTDHATGLLNRAAWDRYVRKAEAHCRALGSPCAAICLELDELQPLTSSRIDDEDLLKRTGRALSAATRGNDAVARLEGSEFGVLIVGLPESGVRTVAERIQTGLANAGISASSGVRMRRVGTSIDDAILGADAAMHFQKASMFRRA